VADATQTDAAGATPASAPTSPGATPGRADQSGATPRPDEPLQDAGKQALEREREARREAERRAKAHEQRLAELEDRDKSEVERERARAAREKQRADDAEARIRELELAALRREIAAEVGLAPALAERLRGEDERSLKADARRLLEVTTPAEGDVGVGRGGGANSRAKGDLNAWIRGGR